MIRDLLAWIQWKRHATERSVQFDQSSLQSFFLQKQTLVKSLHYSYNYGNLMF